MKIWITTLAVAGMLVSQLAAQDQRGEIAGRITDPSNAVVAGARVTASQPATGVAAAATSSTSGEYLLPFLAPGIYDVTVEKAGFRPFRVKSVTVAADDSTTVNAQLSLGGASESIQVVASAPTVESGGAASGIVVESEAILELPAQGGNPVMLAILTPGVANLSEGGTTRAYDNENASAIAVNGSAAGTHEYKVDGAANTGGSSGNVAAVPPAGVVSEIKVESSPFDARNGFSSGASINLSLRPGAKAIHGQLNYYLENPATNANSFFSNRSGIHDNFRENRWGGNASGPVEIPHLVHKGRMFWMYGYEGIHASQPYGTSNLTYTVPTAAERQGNLADLLAYGSAYQIYDPASTRTSTTAGRLTRNPFTGNIIPASRLDPVAQNILSTYYPLPNIPGAKPTGVNYSMPSIQAIGFDSHTARIDQAIGENQRLAVRFNASDRTLRLQERFNGGAGNDGERENRGFGVDDAIVFGPRLLLGVHYSYTRYLDDYAPPSSGLDFTGLGFSQTYANQIRGVDSRNLMLPDITPAGYAELNAQAAIRAASDIHSAGFDFTRVARNHTLRFGGEYRVYRDTSGNTGRSAGKLNFNTNWTCGPLDNSPASPMGEGLASFLLGLPTDGSMDVNPSLAQQYQVSGWYLQDNWKVSPRLTLNVGVRWEYEIPLTERYNRSVREFDPGAALSIEAAVEANYAKSPIPQIPKANFLVRGGVTFAGVNGMPRTLWKADAHNFAPRMGLAWLLDRKTVVRAGYGMFYDVARQNAIQTGFSRTTSLVASTNNGLTYSSSLANPFPNGLSLPSGSSLGAMTNAGQSISVFPDRLLNPYAQRWDVTIQRTVGRQLAVEIGYAGSRAVHLRVARQLDPIPAKYLTSSILRDNPLYTSLTTNVTNPFYPLLPGTNLSGSTVQLQQLLRPYPQFTSVMSANNDGFSWYHAFHASGQKRFNKNWLMTAAYTWSRFMEATSYLNETDPVPYRTLSNSDRPHRIVTSFLFQPRFARGWQLQGIYQWQSGAPINFGNVIYYGGPVALPSGQRSVSRWFNTGAFERGSATQPAYNLRTFPLRFDTVRTHELNMLDLGIAKNIRLKERYTLQIRADAFNAENHTHFGAPNTSPTSTDFGAITSTSQLPRIVEFSLRIQF